MEEKGYLGVAGAGGEGLGGCDGGKESCGKKGWWRMRRLWVAGAVVATRGEDNGKVEQEKRKRRSRDTGSIF